MELKPTHPLIKRSGRWSQSSSATLTASWCSASILFLFSGRSLRIRPGKRTERKDRWNGGIPMLVWTITSEDSDEHLVVGSADAEPLNEIDLVDEVHAPLLADRVCHVQIMLVDWASLFEIEAIVVESAECIKPFPSVTSSPARVLLIGDSISCGYTLASQESGQPTRGYYDAFPVVAQRLIRKLENPLTVQIDTIAYPGITLVNPTESEAAEGMTRGMADRFFHCSPWDATPLTEYEHPSVVIISLGTNDEACGFSEERFATTLHEFIKRLLDLFRASLMCLCIIHPFPDFTEPQLSTLASTIPAVLDRIRVESGEGVSLYNFGIANAMSHELTEDGLHPTTEGHKVLGQNLAEQLAAILHYRVLAGEGTQSQCPRPDVRSVIADE